MLITFATSSRGPADDSDFVGVFANSLEHASHDNRASLASTFCRTLCSKDLMR